MEELSEKALSIQEVADLLNVSYITVYAHRLKWGFFQMEGSRMWRVFRSDLENNRKKQNNSSRLCVQIGDSPMENKLCRSEKTNTVFGKLTLPHHSANDFDVLVKRLTKS
ncbi:MULTISPECIES: helix-turn-helix domain-containing protein [Lonepinella]|uniref:helix-turn-helix domain-containing protein n=1 Tax=Lonepinella TaxID=53416 RepID=UPI003F6DC642